ncbi:MAG: YihY/virulence factor BrkB family protein [Blautia sp.]|nr:YihY/virulence factor BrkB family protein [Blautia sp.]
MSEPISRKQSVVKKIKGFIDRAFKDHIPAYAATASYFLIMSFIPFVMFLSTLIRFTPVTYNMMREALTDAFPDSIQPFVMEIVSDVYRRDFALIPITAVTAIWSACKGVQAITNGLNTIYHVKETRNWLITRIYSMAYTMLFSIALVGSLVLIVLGRQLQNIVAGYNEIAGQLIGRILDGRVLLTPLLLFVVFLILYRFLPNRKATFRSQMPGAAIVSFAWTIFSGFLSIYFNFFPGFSNMYGNMATLILIMMWLYFLMNIMLYGAEINIYFENELRFAEKHMRKRLEQRKKS